MSFDSKLHLRNQVAIPEQDHEPTEDHEAIDELLANAVDATMALLVTYGQGSDLYLTKLIIKWLEEYIVAMAMEGERLVEEEHPCSSARTRDVALVFAQHLSTCYDELSKLPNY